MATVGRLDSYFTSLINDLMLLERQPVNRLKEQKDKLDVQKAVYGDLKSRLDGLQAAVQSPKSSEAGFSLTAGRKAAVFAPSGAVVATASASASALTGVYTLEVSQLARGYTVRSDQQTYSDQRLGKTGKILFGAEDRSADYQDNQLAIVASVVESDPTDGKTELGSGAYFIETQQDADSGKWQFRLVDKEGTAASIKTAGGSYSAAWQDIPTENLTRNTGRGLTITFAANQENYTALSRANGAAQVDYTAKGTIVEVKDAMSLNSLAAAINSAAFADGDRVTAAVINRQLVLQSSRTGAGVSFEVSDYEGDALESLGVLNAAGGVNNYNALTDAAQNAIFKINGLETARTKNTGLTDVISGVTLNLAADAKDKAASLTVSADLTTARSAVTSFIAKFNELQTYLKAKVAVTKNADGTFTRGSLSADLSLRTLNQDLYGRFTARFSTGGLYTRLQDLGLVMNDSLEASVGDSSKLDAALANNLPDVQKLMDDLMGDLNNRLKAYAGDKGYAGTARKAAEDQIELLDDRITALNERLSKREEQLTQQYSEIQAQLLQLTYTQQQFATIYSATTNLSY